MGQGSSNALLNCGKNQQRSKRASSSASSFSSGGHDQYRQKPHQEREDQDAQGRRRRWQHWRQEAWHPRPLSAQEATSPDSSTTFCCAGWSSHNDEIKTNQGGGSGEVSSLEGVAAGGMPIGGGELTVGGAGGGPSGHSPHLNYDPECARMEAWLDEHQDFVQDYFIRKASRHMVDAWLMSHALPQNMGSSGGTYMGLGGPGMGGGGGPGGSGASAPCPGDGSAPNGSNSHSGQPPGSRASSGSDKGACDVSVAKGLELRALVVLQGSLLQ
ncbi:uncharacterized protein, partial [Palaemon carinicauda]|uniref:uncharacterized protein n=1 Tax=Palaemon carinicauda TaxID=392227 RepID=UPI0035B5B505